MKSRNIILPAIALALGGGILLAGTQVSAIGYGPGNNTLITKLAQAFGKSEDEVQAVFNQLHEDQMAEHQQQVNTKLDDAVAQGTITEAQKQLILAKQEELRADKQADLENWQNLTPEERRTQMQAHREEMQTWANDNGINLSLLNLGWGKGMMGGGRGGHMGFDR